MDPEEEKNQPDDDAQAASPEQQAADAVEEGISDVLDGGVDDIDAPADGDTEKPDESVAASGEPDSEGGDQASARADSGPAKGGDDGSGEQGIDGADQEKGSDGSLPDYSFPDGLGDRANERFHSLVEDNKSVRTENEQMKRTLTGMQTMVSRTGLDQREFLEGMDMVSMLKNKPEEGIKRARAMIEAAAKEHGIPVEGMEVDLLADFPDLRDSVDDLEMTESAAIEVAKARKLQTRQQQQQNHQQQEAQNAQQYTQAQQQVMPQVGAYLGQLEKSIDWAAKGPLIMEAAKYARTNLHPSQWLEHLKSENERIDNIVKAMGPGDKRRPRPITGEDTPAGGKREPQTVEEAIDAVLS